MIEITNNADDGGQVLTINIISIQKMYIFRNIQTKIF
jgi:hypothetical protein